MTHASAALLSPLPTWGRQGHGLAAPACPPTTLYSPSPAPGPAGLPETLMGTTLVWTEQDWCHCFSSTVGRGKALGQAVCLSGVVGRLREASGGLTPSAVAPLLSSSLARRLGGCRERCVSGQIPPQGQKGPPLVLLSHQPCQPFFSTRCWGCTALPHRPRECLGTRGPGTGGPQDSP